ncbi:oligosaccharide repeat unit polymerase [Halanaerobium congolense]|uniref:Oligosaccharide repeat unit polymerase n=1 Tax=Halanaerobium congolense TaxID=54121 RepID=A0A318E4N0_9FIRM|nr:O-antigen polymerase [Halanaerobium congolense]PXV63072.1 oligosaccharide repeat unit polymerase [Halanaerobium congolense]
MGFLFYTIVLFLHLIFLQFNQKKLSSPLGIYGIVWLGLIVFSRIGFVEYNSFTFEANLIYLLNYFMFLLGSLTIKIGVKWQINKKKLLNKINYERLNLFNDKLILYVIRILLFISLFSIIIKWIVLINNFGSLTFIINHANHVRYQLIGSNNLNFPFYYRYIAYLSSLSIIAAVFSSFYVIFISSKVITPYLSLIILLLNDLVTFGRINIIWGSLFFVSAFIISVYLGINKINYKTILKYIIIVVVVFLIINLPRQIRSNGVGLISNISDTFKSYYIYATGGFTAFSEYLRTAKSSTTNGWAFFNPFMRFFERLGIIKSIDFSYIYDFIDIPFRFNVFTILRDIYSDFGIIGIILIPYILGGFSTYICFSLKYKFKLTTILMLIYIYMSIIFSVIYNPFSMGVNIIGLGGTLILGLFLEKKGVVINANKS